MLRAITANKTLYALGILLALLYTAMSIVDRLGYFATIGLLLAGYFCVFALLRPYRVYFIALTLYPFWMIGFSLTGASKFLNVSYFMVLLLLWIIAKALSDTECKIKCSRMDKFILVLGIWYFVVWLAQSDFELSLLGSAVKNSVWMFAWVPARYFLRKEKSFDLFIYAMVIQLVVVSIFTLQELYTNWNYFSWADPANTQDTYITARYGIERLSGFFGASVPTALFIAMVIPFALVRRNRVLAAVSFLGIIAGVMTFYYTQVRSAIAGLMLSSVIVFFGLWVKGQKRNTIFIASLVCVPLLLYLGTSLNWVVDTFSPGSQAALSLDRVSAWSGLLGILPTVPFFGYGFKNLLVSDTWNAVSTRDWPMGLYGYVYGGPVYGFLIETYLVIGSMFLLWACLKPSRMPLGYRLAAFVGFATQALALHINWASYGVPLSAIYIAFVQSGLSHYDRQ